MGTVTMSTITRTLRNLRKVGFKDYVMQMVYIGDTKAGTLIGTDRAGNKFFENMGAPAPHPLGRVRQARLRRRPDRARLARVDELPGRQASRRGQAAPDRWTRIRADNAEAQLHNGPGSVQDIQHNQVEDYTVAASCCAEVVGSLGGCVHMNMGSDTPVE